LLKFPAIGVGGFTSAIARYLTIGVLNVVLGVIIGFGAVWAGAALGRVFR